MNFRTLPWLAVVALKLACSPPTPSAAGKRGPSDASTAQPASPVSPTLSGKSGIAADTIPLPESVFTEKVDGSALRIWNIVISTQRLGEATGKQVIANAAFEFDGKAETVEYHICPLDSAESNPVCIDGSTLYYRLRLYNLFPGKVLFKARACVSSERSSSNDNCGQWAEQTYQSPFFDARRAAIDQEIINGKRDLRKLGLDYHQALADFVKESNACVVENTEAEEILRSKVRVVEQFLHAPARWFEQSAEDLAAAVLGEEKRSQVADRVSRFSNAVTGRLDEACKNLGKASHDLVCGFLKGMASMGQGFILCLNPLAAVSTVSVALHDIYYGTIKGQGDKLVASNCYAEQKLQNTVGVIKKQIEITVGKLAKLNQQR